MKPFKLLKQIGIASSILLILSPISVLARTSAEIAQDITNQQNQLNQTQNQLNQAKTNLDKYTLDLSSVQGGVPAIEAEIKKIEAEIEYNKIQLDLYSQNKALKELEKLQREITRINSVRSNYMEWRTTNTDINKVIKEDYDFRKNEKYTEIVADKQNTDINYVNSEIGSLLNEITKYETAKSDLEKKQGELVQKKKDLEAQIAYLAYLVSYSGNQINSLQVSVKNIQGSIQSLSEQQRQAILREEEILRQNQGALGNTNCTKDPNAAAGTYYFCGNGRDLVMGHGVGMSQYGAKGAAEQGLSATQILQFYYTGAQVTQYPLNTEITVKYCQGNPVYAAYQEGCNYNGNYYGPTVTERVSFDTYLAGLGEMPEGWHADARKAQIIAARTYAAKYTNNGDPNYPICLSTYCQVSYFKSGDQNELSLVQQTKDLVITYGGQLIEALYSADNNQGNGTADYDTRFQSLGGTGSADRPYLKSVNDNQYAQNSRLYWNYYCQGSPCGLWQWKTYAYTMQDVQSMLYHNQLGQWMLDIGGLKSLSFERDASLRVKRVYLNGNSGQVRVIGGWWFKYYWNEWVSSRGTNDFIYSQTYYLNVN